MFMCFSSPQERNQLSACSVNPNTKEQVTFLWTHIAGHTEPCPGQEQMKVILTHSCACTARRGRECAASETLSTSPHIVPNTRQHGCSVSSACTRVPLEQFPSEMNLCVSLSALSQLPGQLAASTCGTHLLLLPAEVAGEIQ